MSYNDLAKRMDEGTVVKAVMGDYVVYKRSWLYENIEQEAVLIKSVREMKPIKDGITRLRDFLDQEKGAKDNIKKGN